jgi:predicted glutamine amidotransferase
VALHNKSKEQYMCGIAGFSLANNSKINARKLSRELFRQIESRGSQASGFAWQKGTKESGIYKKDVAGSQIRLKGLPKNADSVILHTRLATHGTIRDMANNHPVISPNKEIALVHNGVIYNHNIVRKHVTGELPEVDTSVIPAALEQQGLQGLEMIEGDAAIAWLDQGTRGVLHLARLEHSPMAIAHVKDGSLVFASTEALLEKALQKAKIEIDWIMTIQEHTKISVVKGVVTEWTNAPKLNVMYEQPTRYTSIYDDGYLWNDRSYMRQQTSGIECPIPTPPDMRLGWNLINGEWKWFDGTTMRKEIDDPSDGTVIVVNGKRVASFIEYLETFTYDPRYKEYFDERGNYAGTEEDLWDEYEMLRYEEYWSNEAILNRQIY